MKLKWVSRRNEEQELNKVYRQIVKRENKYHIAEESTYIHKKENIFKKIAGGKKVEKKPSKIREKYQDSWLNRQINEIKEDLSDLILSIKYYIKKLKFGFRDFRVYAKSHFFNVVVGFFVLIIIGVGVFTYNNLFAYEVVFNGTKIGVVKNVEDFEQALTNVDANLTKWYGSSNVFYEKSISYQKVPIENPNDILDSDECENAIYNMNLPLFCKGAVITVNGEEAVRVASTQDAKTVISNIGSIYEEENENEKVIKSSEVKEDLEYKEKLISIDSAMEVHEAIEYLNDTSDNKVVNNDDSNILNAIDEAKEGTNLVSALNFRADDFATEEIDSKPSITITTVKQVTYKEDVDYKTIYKDDSSVYVGTTKVTQEGKDGEKKVTAVNTYENGEVVESDVQSEEIIEDYTPKIVARGSKPLPPTTSSGTFIMPASGTISALNKAGSHAGYKAVDIANPTGTPIYASDTGIVVRAGWYAGYGNCVDIDHGNGYLTRYGHNSSILVTVGQKVQQGEKIALMGSTGNSTGPHCHFEIHYNGVQQVILNYFDYLRNGLYVNALQE
ncbi:peptidoglycan DD-metalloendopeptidase family protein [Anaerofustis sp. NSJ-163]|uniref:peptidoglycan DD-metalloendopeptidase family protein n=1 Tax=Anaerofustis sp. NSJ-163 TaxID=2944391 RepID=UPI00209BD987|nr:peptidoglycan DD-metalloendopeptidase family protein [Anaerofustis sp. NSJ-163]MCO8194457.1 peptidoglycan DD-metalloendopeptidase family protein [Anaerofustis sp. NSJ-163]